MPFYLFLCLRDPRVELPSPLPPETPLLEWRAYLRIGDSKNEFEIVGIASDAVLDDPRTPEAPAIYTAAFQRPDYLRWGTAIVRSRANPANLAGALRQRIENLGREYPLHIETVDEEFDRTLVPERMLALMTSFFGVLALLLAAIGLYGLLAYTIARRTRELGVRMALGATSRTIGLLVLRDVAILLSVGLAAGLAIALVAGRAITAFLYGLSSYDPSSLALAAGVLIIVAGFATMIPAIRAIRIDPATALRYE